MPTKMELLQEANRRGLLSGRQKALVDEATRRGLIGNGGSLSTDSAPTEEAPAVVGGEPNAPTLESAQEQQPGNYLFETVSNIPESGAQFVKDIVTPFIHPVETAKAVGNLAAGIGQKLIPGKQEKEVYAEKAMQFIKDRYGSLENIGDTIKTDPVGFLADFASLVSGGGLAVRAAGGLTKVKKISDAGRLASKVGTLIEPTRAVRAIASKSAKVVIPKGLPSSLYKSAAKFSSTFSDAEITRLSETALAKAIMPTSKGLAKLEREINGINQKITKMIDDAMSSGGKIPELPIKRLFREFRTLHEDAALSGRPLKAQKAINNVRKELFAANHRLGRNSLTIKQAQALKQRIYRETQSYFSKSTESPASVKAQHAIAKAAKESIEDIFPEIKQLNSSEGALIALRKALENPVKRISRRDISGLGIPMKATAGGVVGGVPGAVVGVGIALFDTPLIKSKLAIVLNKIKSKGITISPNSGFVYLGLYQAGRGENKTKKTGFGGRAIKKQPKGKDE
jgi:hypothetical protein